MIYLKTWIVTIFSIILPSNVIAFDVILYVPSNIWSPLFFIWSQTKVTSSWEFNFEITWEDIGEKIGMLSNCFITNPYDASGNVNSSGSIYANTITGTTETDIIAQNINISNLDSDKLKSNIITNITEYKNAIKSLDVKWYANSYFNKS